MTTITSNLNNQRSADEMLDAMGEDFIVSLDEDFGSDNGMIDASDFGSVDGDTPWNYQ